ncbi:unnamed protein product [Strongylus vulgaris]|uniref:Uncharacterized protein n=1 Tax=Strongylus vulgaris TaxID=40348 RepID=A0A3P7JCX1_STRVU|nr:unnamed protein product [Strongylus vulgaris]
MGDLDQDSGMRTVLLGSYPSHDCSWQLHLHEGRTPNGTWSPNESCENRPYSHQPKVLLTGRFSGTILQQWFRPPPSQSRSAIRPKAGQKDLSPCWRKEEVVYNGVRLEELLITYDWPIEDDPAKHYDLLLGRLRACMRGLNVSNKEHETNFDNHQGNAKEEESTETESDCITSRVIVANTGWSCFAWKNG